LLLILGAAALLAGCSRPPAEDLVFDGQRAYQFVAEQLSFGARHPGSPGHWQVGDWILQRLQAEGWETSIQPFSHQGLDLRNLIGRKAMGEGAIILLGAHYDTRPLADADPMNPSSPVPGANDGASGVAVLLELARVLAQKDLCAEVWLVFFDAEDSGDLNGWVWAMGSAHFVQEMGIAPQAVVIVDMVGDSDLQLYFELNSDPDLSSQIWRVADTLGYETFIPEYRHSLLDDHTAFLMAGFPAVDIIDFDYPYWHTTLDTLERVSSESLEQVGRTLQTWVQSCP
jgi:hypothetical protein